MERPPKFNFTDVLWAPGKALSGKKITVMTTFLILALAVWDIFTYLALAIDGQRLSYIWAVWNFFPLNWFAIHSIVAQLIWAVGWALSLLTLMMGFLAVSAINLEEIRGYPFLGLGSAIRFAFRRLGQLFLSELTLVLFIAIVVVAFAILGLISRIPVVGEWIYALGFVFPGFVVAILTIFVIAITQISVLLLPATAAADRQGETFTAIIETFSTVLRHPLRWLGYTGYSLVSAKLAGFVFAYFCYRAVQFMVASSGLLGGRERLTELVGSGLAHLPVGSQLVRDTFNIFPGIDWSFSVSSWAWSTYSGSAASYVMAAMLFIIFASIWGYMLAILATAQARGYVVIRYLKDGYNITDEDSLFYTDEPVNPPIEEGEK